MPFKMRKIRGKDLYKVFNAITGEIKSNGSSKVDAKKQLRLLRKYEKEEKKGGALPADDIKEFIDESYESKLKDVGEDNHFRVDPELSDERVKVYVDDRDGKVVSVHRGSADWRDWLDNYFYVTRGSFKSTPTYKLHEDRQKKINAKYGKDKVTMIGHSRAGKYVEELNKDMPTEEVLTYNKATNWSDIGRKNPKNQTDIRSKSDPVSSLSFLQRNKNKVVKTKGSWNPLKSHGTGSLSSLGKKLIGRGYGTMRVKEMRDFLRDHHKVNGLRKAYGKVNKKTLTDEMKTLMPLYMEGGADVGYETPPNEPANPLPVALRNAIVNATRDPPTTPARVIAFYNLINPIQDVRNRYIDAIDDGHTYNPTQVAGLTARFDAYINTPHPETEGMTDVEFSDDDGADDLIGMGVSKTLAPFFCRIGSKKPLAKTIVDMIPEHKTYIEPFFGGGAIYWAKPPSAKEVVNDLDKGLIEGYKMLKNANPNPEKYKPPISAEEYKKDVRPGRRENTPSYKRGVEKLREYVNKPGGTKEDKLLKKLYQYCNTFSSKGVGKIYRAEIGSKKINKIGEYVERMKQTTILNEDYKKLLKKYDGKDAFFFLDPPYEASEGLYKEGSFNFGELRNELDKIKGKFLLTLNDSKEIRKIFKGFKIKGIKVRGGGFREDAPIGGAGNRKEVIITNY
tara:strand:- start:1148 stop:3178 length:2031 start_codon:yes stop_codon:yes gene_type:complete